MLAALLLSAAAPATAVEAERAFAADAQKIGQWSAFRKWAADDAVMFAPRPTSAHDYLRPLKDPATAVDWWPTVSVVSCDGKMAVNTGGAKWPDGHASYFSTIWSRASGAWRWTFDHGDDLETARPRPSVPVVWQAACGTRPDPIPQIAFRCAPQASGEGGSPDGTLAYRWYVPCGGGARHLTVSLWQGSRWVEVLSDSVRLKAKS